MPWKKKGTENGAKWNKKKVRKQRRNYAIDSVLIQSAKIYNNIRNSTEVIVYLCRWQRANHFNVRKRQQREKKQQHTLSSTVQISLSPVAKKLWHRKTKITNFWSPTQKTTRKQLPVCSFCTIHIFTRRRQLNGRLTHFQSTKFKHVLIHFYKG